MQATPDTQADIEALLERFLDGNTTVEEEERLATYLRDTPHLPADWQVYREMFGYFDDGMPIGALPQFDGVAKGDSRRHTTPWLRRTAALTTVAAAAAVLLYVMLPHMAEPLPGTAPQQAAYAQSEPTTSENDTLQAPAENDSKSENSHRTVRRHYEPAPPKRYYAKTATGVETQSPLPFTTVSKVYNDTATAATAGTIMADQREIADQQRQLQETIRETQRLIDEARTTLMATEDYADECD